MNLVGSDPLSPAAVIAPRVTAVPGATARVQLNAAFTFDDARACLAYLQDLGISHLFVSPILTARAGSAHGYDVVDHAAVSAELGGEEGLRRLVAELRVRGMGLVVDVVPNHMAVGGADNARWLDVLEWGRESASAGFFDIDWDRPDPALAGRVLAPFLGERYGEALAEGRLRLEFDAARGRFFVAYAEHVFPIAAAHYPLLLSGATPAADFEQVLRRRRGATRRGAFAEAAGRLARAWQEDAALRERIGQSLARLDPATPAGRGLLHRLLERQHYRLAWWRTAADEINWRRFFDVTGLAGIRVEERAVFEAVHATLLRLYAQGLVDGLRIDHVDGLSDPRGYCRALRARLHRERPADHAGRPCWVVVEKILARDERLAADWQVDGTSGYSFMNELGALLHDPRGHARLLQFWNRHDGGLDFAQEEERARRRISRELFVAEFGACAHALHAIAREQPSTRDWTLAAIKRVLAELLAHFPRYRTYADGRGRSAEDARIMQQAVAAAAGSCRPAERELLERIDAWLGGEPPKDLRSPAARRARLRAIARFQQLTPPLAAKAVEDTAFYRHGLLLSRNEVGADPRQFALPAQTFHAICADRRQRYPKALLATATHDHKRGEDVRARLSVLSECADAWVGVVGRWRRFNEALREHDAGTAPDEVDEYLLYQMLVGTWPTTLDPADDAAMGVYRERLAGWQLKALREAKRRSSWNAPDLAYEQACRAFLDGVLDPARASPFLDSLRDQVEEIAPTGALKGLTQALLRMTCPGVPDLYQGTEFWDLSMVDPDNRRAVDYAARAAALRDDAPGSTLLAQWRSGAVKQRLIARTLACRASDPALFEQGEYQGLALEGRLAQQFIAFLRRIGHRCVLVIAPLHVHAFLRRAHALRMPAQALLDTAVVLPSELRHCDWFDALEQRPLAVDGSHVSLAAVLDIWPLALLRGTAG